MACKSHIAATGGAAARRGRSQRLKATTCVRVRVRQWQIINRPAGPGLRTCSICGVLTRRGWRQCIARTLGLSDGAVPCRAPPVRMPVGDGDRPPVAQQRRRPPPAPALGESQPWDRSLARVSQPGRFGGGWLRTEGLRGE